MNFKSIITSLFLIFFASTLIGQEKSFDVVFRISITEEMKPSFRSDGRLFVFLNQNPNVEPYTQSWPSKENNIFAKNITGLEADNIFIIENPEGWKKTSEWDFKNVPEGVYYVQILWDQDMDGSNLKAPGNLYSTKQKIEVNKSTLLNISLDKQMVRLEIEENDMVKFVDFKSDTLSKWWNRPMYLKASILLPGNYDRNLNKEYPIRYNIAGYGGRFTRINRAVKNEKFMEWWESDDAPEVINVFLDGDSPFGDSYHMDSDNSGPYGYALINELIPYIESKYRGTNSAETRFVDGCSTGGWVSLALQLYYPDTFNGVFSYSPDAVEFENYQLINIYKDKNVFTNEFGYLRPVMRMPDGEPRISLERLIQYENVLGASNSYLNSGGQFSAHTALYSERAENGLPSPLFDPETGEIDSRVAESWKKYDFKLYVEKNWEELGSKLQGKIFIWMGDMDHFYLNLATRSFSDYLKTTTGPKSDAVIVFSPTKGHCTDFSNKVILQQIKKRLEMISSEKGGK